MNQEFFTTLANREIILASQSPRRKQLLEQMGIKCRVKSLIIDENYPSHLKKEEITEFLTQKKSESFGKLTKNQILITADTLVWHKKKCFEKPKNTSEAEEMLTQLSHSKHTVYSSVCMRTSNTFQLKTDKTQVYFKHLSQTEINYYLNNYSPFDKAGSYGIQDWVGLCKIAKIKGSYYTVMGLPTHFIFTMLKNINEKEVN